MSEFLGHYQRPPVPQVSYDKATLALCVFPGGASAARFAMKVYISSTYQDLIDHCAAVDRTSRRMGDDVIGMLQYIAEGGKPVDRCQADVHRPRTSM